MSSIFISLIKIIAPALTGNANPAMERPAITQLHGIRTNKIKQCN